MYMLLLRWAHIEEAINQRSSFDVFSDSYNVLGCRESVLALGPGPGQFGAILARHGNCTLPVLSRLVLFWYGGSSLIEES